MKGGTGRTTLAVEIACLLASDHGGDAAKGAPRKVALLDLDTRSPSVGVRLGIGGPSVLDYAIAPPDERRVADLMPMCQGGLRLLLGSPRPSASAWPLNAALVREVLRELDLEGFDVVVVDVAAEPSALTTAVLASADDVFVVVNPTAGGVQDAYRTTETLRRLGVRHARYVVNRGRRGVDVGVAMDDLRGQVVAEIPEDDDAIRCENNHELIARTDGPAAIALRRFARAISRELAAARAG